MALDLGIPNGARNNFICFYWGVIADRMGAESHEVDCSVDQKAFWM